MDLATADLAPFISITTPTSFPTTMLKSKNPLGGFQAAEQSHQLRYIVQAFWPRDLTWWRT
jgi:hypothetical protein